MKQTRRKELKTNDLRVYLQQIYAAMERHSSYILGGLVVVVLILVIGLYVQHNRMSAIQAAWDTYYELHNKDVVAQPELLERARTLAANKGSDSQIGPSVLQLKADLACNLALGLTDAKDEARKLDLLKEAKTTYEQVMSQFPNRPDVKAGAGMSLAKVEESLAALGQGDPKRVRELYQQLIDSKPNAYAESAAKELKDLDERLRPLQIVASRPAEPPASAPAKPTTRAAMPISITPTIAPVPTVSTPTATTAPAK